MMTKEQINWAKQHDWFINSIDGKVMVEGILTDREGNVEHLVEEFDNFLDLKEWAGY